MASSDIPSRVCFPYYLTRDVNFDIKVKVRLAQGLIPRSFTVSAVIKSARRALHQSSKDTSSPSTVFPYVTWDEWLVFPVRYSDLSSDAEIEFTFRDQGFRPVYRATLELFERNHLVLKTGAQRVRIRTLKAHADERRRALTESHSENLDVVGERASSISDDETPAFRIEKVNEKLESEGNLLRTPWLERLVKERIEAERRDQIQVDAERSIRAHFGDVFDQDPEPAWLLVELPKFRIPILCSEKPYVRKAYAKPKRILFDGDVAGQEMGQEWLAQVDPNTGKTFYQIGREEKQTWKRPVAPVGSDIGYGWEPNLSRYIEDPETEHSSPALQKTLKLFRSGTSVREKPDKKEASDIEKILKSPILKNTLKPQEAALLWQFRHVLCSRGDALVKFLYSVDKTDAHDVKQALELLEKWADIDVADALILLSEDFTHDPSTSSPLDVAVRRFAVKTLQQSASDADVRLYLLQLVQALRHEPDLKALQHNEQETAAPAVDSKGDNDNDNESESGSAAQAKDLSLSPLADFLLDRCVSNRELSNFFHWFVEVETHARDVGELYSRVHNAFHEKLMVLAPDVYNEMSKEQELVMKFVALGTEVQNSGGTAEKREKKMRTMLSASGPYGDLRELDESIPLPHMPSVRIKGLVAEKTKVFKSALCPFVLAFIVDDVSAAVDEAREIQKTLIDDEHDNRGTQIIAAAPSNESEKEAAEGEGSSQAVATKPTLMKVMMKVGDDLRQDQLIIQMIHLMDTILKRVNLDLKLSPYAVLAVSRTNGMLEFLSDSPRPLSQLKDIRRFLAEKHPSSETEVGIRPDVLDTFVRSCAGSAVITWILAVGDRHLDNIMLKTDTGQLVHIDFGYIFGHEPKQNVPNIRVTKAMVDAMGGPNSKHYQQFKNLAGQGFNILRRHANLILALLKLMSQADLEDCSADDFYVVQDRFLLGHTDEEAERHLMSEIEFSVGHRWVAMMDLLHDMATAMR